MEEQILRVAVPNFIIASNAYCKKKFLFMLSVVVVLGAFLIYFVQNDKRIL